MVPPPVGAAGVCTVGVTLLGPVEPDVEVTLGPDPTVSWLLVVVVVWFWLFGDSVARTWSAWTMKLCQMMAG